MLDTTIIFTAPGTRTQDAEGIWHDGTSTTREVFARMESASRGEFYAGGVAGFRAELRFTIFHAEYKKEKTRTWNGDVYAIGRTYQKPGTDDLELYVKREVGVHSGAQNTD